MHEPQNMHCVDSLIWGGGKKEDKTTNVSNWLLWYRISYIVFKPSYILQILNMGTCINHLWQGEQGDPSYPLKSFVPVWNLRAIIWFPFLIASHFFCLVLHFLSCHFSANGPIFFPENSQTFFVNDQAFFLWLLLSSWMVVGMSGLLPCGTGIFHYTFVYVLQIWNRTRPRALVY